MKTEMLNLPIVKSKFPSAKKLSMNDYLKFITFNLKFTCDIKSIRKRKRHAYVKVPFYL